MKVNCKVIIRRVVVSKKCKLSMVDDLENTKYETGTRTQLWDIPTLILSYYLLRCVFGHTLDRSTGL